MHRAGQQPLRPMPVQGGGDLQQLLELARTGALNRSAFTSVGGSPAGFLPEFSIYSTAQLSGLLGSNGNLSVDQLAQLQQLQSLQTQAALALGSAGQQGQQQPESSGGVSRNSQGRATSRGDKGSTAYASRHQAAEARRRTRINDRLERLRQIVPHSERANTATFLEEVFKYVEALQARLTELETAQGLPLSQPQKQISTVPQPWLQSNSAPIAQTVAVDSTVKPVALLQPAAPVHQQAALSLPASLSLSTAAPPQRDRPETPPQNTLQEASEDAAADVRENTPDTSSEGSVAKKARHNA